MDWDNVRFFLAVARLGTLSRAAKSLGVTHVTVSRRIDRLEALLNETLFNRLQSGYTLTAVGENILPEAEAVEQAFIGFQRQVLSKSEAPTGELSISLPEPCAIDLAPALADFIDTHPHINLRISSTMDTLNLNQLEAEVVIRVTNEPPEMLVGRELMKLPYGPYAAKRYVEAHGRDLDNANWVIWQNVETRVEDYLAAFAGIKNSRVVMHSDTNTQMLHALKAGCGIGIVTQQVAEACPDLVALSPKPWGEMGLWILTHRNLRYAKRIKQFMQFMGEYDLREATKQVL